jgi:hypothetical protein
LDLADQELEHRVVREGSERSAGLGAEADVVLRVLDHGGEDLHRVFIGAAVATHGPDRAGADVELRLVGDAAHAVVLGPVLVPGTGDEADQRSERVVGVQLGQRDGHGGHVVAFEEAHERAGCVGRSGATERADHPGPTAHPLVALEEGDERRGDLGGGDHLQVIEGVARRLERGALREGEQHRDGARVTEGSEAMRGLDAHQLARVAELGSQAIRRGGVVAVVEHGHEIQLGGSRRSSTPGGP